MKKLSVVALVSLAGLLMFNGVIFAHDNHDDHSCDDNNYSHNDNHKDSDHGDDDDCEHDNDHNHSHPTPTPSPTPTPKPTHTPRPTATPMPTATPKPTATPTMTPTATPNPTPADVCANIDGIQTSVPDTYHLAGSNCLQWELGGAPTPPSTGTGGQVLGASTSVLADTASPLTFPRAIIGIIGAAISFVFSRRIIA